MNRWISPTAAAAASLLVCAACGRAERLEKPRVLTGQATTAASVTAAPPKLRLRHGVFRYTSYPAAWTAAQETGRPILVFATAPSCPHCVRMIGETYRSPQISRLVTNSFETVYVDRLEQPKLAAKLKIRWFPTTIIVGPDNQVIDVIEGYVDAKTFASRLRPTIAAHSETTKTR